MLQEYKPFPPPQQPRKVDLQLESGEYFLSGSQKASRAEGEKVDRQREAVEERKRKREEAFQPPKVCAGTEALGFCRLGLWCWGWLFRFEELGSVGTSGRWRRRICERCSLKVIICLQIFRTCDCEGLALKGSDFGRLCDSV